MAGGGGGGGLNRQSQIYNKLIKIFRKRGTFCEQKYRRLEDPKPVLGLAFNRDFSKKGELELNANLFFLMFKLKDVKNKLM